MDNKGKERRQFSDTQICWFLYGLTFLMMVVLGSTLSISYILDETGTVANAAYLAGYNWNDWVNSTGGYFYKYGQAVFYYPIFKLVSNPYLIYKLMMLVNGIFVACIPVIAYKILRKHLKQEDRVKCILASFCVAVVPATVLYSLYARADVMLIAFAWITLYAVLECMEADSSKKKILMSGLAAFFSVYMYMCHSRGIVFVIAVCMVVVVIRLFLKEKGVCLWAYFLNLVLWLFVDDKLTHYFKNSIWGSGNKKNTFENVNYDKYSSLFTAEGIETVIKNVTGWLFNSFLGTFGLAILGIFFAITGVICFIAKKKDISKKEVVISLYAVLVYFGTVAMSVLFSYGSNYKFVTGVSIKRADRFLYSRYVAPAYALLVFIALFYLFFKADCFKIKTKITALVFGGGLILYCRTWLAGYVNGVEYSWRNTIDSALFFDTVRYGNDANKYNGVSRALLLAAVLAFFVLLVMIIFSRLKVRNKNYFLVCIGACFLVSLSVNYIKLRYATDVRAMLTAGPVITQMYNLENSTDISEEYSDVYVDPSYTRHKMLQLAMPEFTVHVNKSIKAKDVNNMFIVAKNYTVNEEWMGDDCYLFEDYDFENSKAAIIVKGEELKAELENRGISLVPISQEYTMHNISEGGTPFMQAVKKVFDYQKNTFFQEK